MASYFDVSREHAAKMRKTAAWHLNPDVCSTEQTRRMAYDMIEAADRIEFLIGHIEGFVRGLALSPQKSNGRIKLTKLNWYGEGSGRSWEYFTDEVSQKIHGEIQAIVIWEDGDSISGLAIKDGDLIEPEVKMSLDLPEDWGKQENETKEEDHAEPGS